MAKLSLKLLISTLRRSGVDEDYRIVLRRHYPNLSIKDALTIAWPRCPMCGSMLIQKMASSRLVCAGCGREFELREVNEG